jgi:hypothetical protein
MAKIDPAQIKTVNWSRKRKRNKKLWDPDPKSRRGRALSVEATPDEIARVSKLLDEAMK